MSVQMFLQVPVRGLVKSGCFRYPEVSLLDLIHIV